MTSRIDQAHFDLRDLVAILKRRRRLILATVVIATALCMTTLAITAPVYKATSAIVLNSSEAHLVNTEGTLEESEQDRTTVETQIDLIQSRSLLRKVIDKLALIDDPEFGAMLASAKHRPADGMNIPIAEAQSAEAATPPADATTTAEEGGEENDWPLLVRLSDGFRELPGDFGQWLGRIRELDALKEQTHRVRTEEERVDVTINNLLNRLDVERSGHGLVFKISASSTDPVKAARIANAVAESYIEWSFETKREAASEAAAWLRSRVGELRKRVSDAEQAVVAYRRAHQLADAPQEDSVLMQLTQLRTQLTMEEVERAAAEAGLAEVQKLLDEGPSVAASVLTSPLLANLRTEEADLQRDRAELGMIYGKRHPQLINIEARMASVRTKMDEEVGRIIGDLRNEVAVARAREYKLQQAVNRLEGTRSGQKQATVSLNELERELEASRTIYSAFVSRLKKLTEQQGVLRPGARFISTAEAPTAPAFPQPKLMLMVSFVGSSMVGALLAFVLEHLDTRLRSGRHVQQTLGIPSLALVPAIGRSKRHLAPYRYLVGKPRSDFAESLRMLQSACLLSDVDTPPQTVIVTSSLPDEGKTTLALCLGATSALEGKQTVVVDLDLHRGRLCQAAGLATSGHGVTDYLLGQRSLDEILQNLTDCDRLSVIPAGRQPIRRSTVLASQRMKALLRELRLRYRFIVLDTPPLLPVNDTRLLASLADAVVVVVRWNATREDAARTAVDYLTKSHGKVVGAVLNRIDVKKYAQGAHGDALQYYKNYSKYYVN